MILCNILWIKALDMVREQEPLTGCHTSQRGF